MEKITFIFYSSIRSLLVISSVHRNQCLAIIAARTVTVVRFAFRLHHWAKCFKALAESCYTDNDLNLHMVSVAVAEIRINFSLEHFQKPPN